MLHVHVDVNKLHLHHEYSVAQRMRYVRQWAKDRSVEVKSSPKHKSANIHEPVQIKEGPRRKYHLKLQQFNVYMIHNLLQSS